MIQLHRELLVKIQNRVEMERLNGRFKILLEKQFNQVDLNLNNLNVNHTENYSIDVALCLSIHFQKINQNHFLF